MNESPRARFNAGQLPSASNRPEEPLTDEQLLLSDDDDEIEGVNAVSDRAAS